MNNLSSYEHENKKRLLAVFVGFCAPLFYYIVLHFILYLMGLEYNEKYAPLENLLLFILPALPGVANAFLLIRNTWKEFVISLSICFSISTIIILLWNFNSVSLKIHTLITGYEEFGLGDGLLMAVASLSYFISCTIGTIISAIITSCRQKRTAHKSS